MGVFDLTLSDALTVIHSTSGERARFLLEDMCILTITGSGSGIRPGVPTGHSAIHVSGCRSGTTKNRREKTKQTQKEKILATVV